MEKRELEIFQNLKDSISIVFDVGARYDLDYYYIHPFCEYHLFEPNLAFADILDEKISELIDAKIKINKFGLANLERENCVYFSDVQSFAKNPIVGGIDCGYRYNLSTLDKYVEQNNILKIDFLKIDTEGLDYFVLLGGK